MSLLMVCLVLLSLGVGFASDDGADAIAIDDIAAEESIAVEEDAPIAVDEGSSNVVTNDTVYNYFDKSGSLLDNVTSDELIFSGTFEDINVSDLYINRSIKLSSDDAVLNDISLSLIADNITVDGFTFNQFNGSSAIVVIGSDVTVANSTISFSDNGENNAIAVSVLDSSNFNLLDNLIYYIGNTGGSYLNNVISLSNVSGSQIKRNEFVASLVSAPVAWFEVPAGSGNWVSDPVSEGIVIVSSNDVEFSENDVKVSYGNVLGSYDTIYTISVKDSNNTVIEANNISAFGHTYIYGIQISGEAFTITENNIAIESDNYYANGIDVEGPAAGQIYKNTIEAKGVESAYAIYSGMNGQNVTAFYVGNNISAEAYLAFGMSIGDLASYVFDNKISAEGNYTMGIASQAGLLATSNNTIILKSSEIGNQSMWESFGVETNGIKTVSGTAHLVDNTIETSGKGIYATGGDVVLLNNRINVVGNDDADAYSVYATNLASLAITENNISYTGKTKGVGINNALYVNNVTEAIIEENYFNMSLVSSYVPWSEVPAGSGYWVSSPVSEGIVIDSSDDVQFTDNIVDALYSDVVGSYDTIYAIDFRNSDNAVIANNSIGALGNTYIYGIILSGENFNISDNQIVTASEVYYANCIDIEGPANGVVSNNFIKAMGVESAYAIYSGMNGASVSAGYSNNTIIANAYNAFGMSLGDELSVIQENSILLEGNYTTGIAYRGALLLANNNTIAANGTGVGDLSIWEAFGVENIGIKVVNGTSTIINNGIITTGNYAIDVKDTAASVHDNFLFGLKFAGDESVNNSANSEVYNNTPVINESNKLATSISIIEVAGNRTVKGVLIADDEPLEDSVTYTVGNISGTVETDEDGVFIIENVTNNELLTISFAADSYRNASNATITLKDIASVRAAAAILGNNYTQYAIDYKAGERGGNFTVQLVDANGVPLANKTVLIGYNGKCLERTTDENGYASVQINLQSENRLTFAVTFLGDDNYNATMEVYLITIEKKPVTINATAKSYKRTTKTKQFKVTLGTVESADGQIFLPVNKKVTLKVNGKTFSAKTNSKGQATFKITNLSKKGKFVANVKYAGDKTYAAASKKVTLTVK